MARDARMLGPLAISLAGHALALAFLYIGARLAWPAPPIPIEVLRPHRAPPRAAPAERPPPPRRAAAASRSTPRSPGASPKPPVPRLPPPPETTDLSPFAPEDASLVVLLRMDKLRASPHRQAVEALLGSLPDWSTLVEGSGVSPLDDFDALLIATSDPSTALAIADDPFARQTDVARANLDAEITYSTDDSPSKPIPSKGGKGKRLSRPGRPKTFGSRAR
jgi:hypothetical protein